MPERFVTPSFVLRTVLRLWQTSAAGVFSLWLLPLFSSSSSAGTIRVDAQGFADFRTIQEGIDAANSGDTVLVEPGTYFEDISFTGRQVALISVAGAAATIIDASNEDSAAVNLFRGEPVGTMVKGFTIRGGKGTRVPAGYREGGGVFGRRANFRLTECIITECSTDWGGGISAGSSSAPPGELSTCVIDNNVITNNTAHQNGGGVQISNSYTDFSDNLVASNVAQFDGGGLEIRYSSGSSSVLRNVFRSNLARDKGGGIRVVCTTPSACGLTSVSHNLVFRNRAFGEDFGETGGGGGIAVHGGVISIQNNTIVGNVSTSESICSGGGILLTEEAKPTTTRVVRNIIAFNTDCGVACRWSAAAYAEANIFWMNELGDVGTSTSRCEGQTQGGVMRVDPEFCSAEGGDSFDVSSTSPALLSPGGPIGAVGVPGCTGVTVVPRTWGWIKNRFTRDK